ncbi:MAG: glycoside hydrolase family 9 protein, partial [Ruminococcus sp.]|nr:glycoside hydrolase family 9 protein [Ruminococcus sp.]
MIVPNGWEVQTVEDTAKSDDLNTSVTNKQQTGNLEIEKNWENDTDSDRPKNLTIGLYRTTKVPASTAITPDLDYDDYSNYAKLLQYSLYFYDANMCGSQVGETSAYSWRDDCHTYNDVDGGFHDAGDHLMLGLPQGFTASTLGWNYYEFKDAFDSLGQTEHYQTIMKYFCDFFVNSVHYNGNNVSEILVQKGSESGNQRDHDYWGNPENQTSENYGKETWMSSGASNIAAEYAAALASYAVNFPDDSNSATYLNTAKALYEFSKKSDGVWNAEGLYSDKNCDDERAWA